MTTDSRPWTREDLPLSERVELVLSAMSLEEKVAQLGSARPTSGTVIAAPGEELFAHEQSAYGEATRHGLGQLTRVLGSQPVEPEAGAQRLAELQMDLVSRTRLGIPAIAHEECLSGFTTYRATIFPTPLAWASTFRPDLVEKMAFTIGEGMAAVGVRQGLAPVLDVVRDHRWGRVEETLGEDPYLVGVMACAYVTGLQAAGVIATLKHFAGYSASRAGRNNAPVSMGPRELQDVVLLPFEMAVRLGKARSVMHAYNEIDGVPAAANRWLLTETLRERWGFDGVVVSDYWGIPFLATTHGVAADDADAGRLALASGVDMELPGTRCFGQHLVEAVAEGAIPEESLNTAVRRVLTEKARLGYLDTTPPIRPEPGPIDLDSTQSRSLARTLAQESVVLLQNTQDLLPLDPRELRMSVIGPCAADPTSLFGCYSFPRHVLERYPGHDIGVRAVSVVDALLERVTNSRLMVEVGCDVSDDDRSRIPDAVAVAAASDVAVVVVGDRSGLFGTGTSGEGCDVESLDLPGVQGELVEAILDTGVPVVLVILAGRPYSLGELAPRCGAILVSFFPGEEGAAALVDVLFGDVSPSGRLPVQIPGRPGGAPATYLHPILGGRSEGISNLDPTPAFPFGHGLTYSRFSVADVHASATEMTTDGAVEVTAILTNVGECRAAEVVQIYLTDVAAEVTRPVMQLIGFSKVALNPGESARLTFLVDADMLSFTGLDLSRIVEPGTVILHVAASAAAVWSSVTVTVTGPRRVLGGSRVMTVPVEVEFLTEGLARNFVVQ
ncbi:MAG: beta-glucosidase [Actinomycetota bacterium]